MIDSLHGGVEGAVNVMENMRVQQTQPQMSQQDQNQLARNPAQGNGAKVETSNAVQGLGENLDLMV